MDEFPKINPPYILGGANDFVNMGLACKALSANIDRLVKGCYSDSTEERLARIQKIKELAERVEYATNRFNQSYCITYSEDDLKPAGSDDPPSGSTVGVSINVSTPQPYPLEPITSLRLHQKVEREGHAYGSGS